MINLQRLQQVQPSLGYFSEQFCFPEKRTFHPKYVEAVIDDDHPAYAEVQHYRQRVEAYTLDEMKACYSDTFDFNKTAPLYMTYHRFDTQKERGQMLAKLKVLYEMFGLAMPDNELSDFLPLMLEFLYAMNYKDEPETLENILRVIMIIEDGTYAMQQDLEDKDSPYAPLVRGLRKTLKVCIETPEEVTVHV